MLSGHAHIRALLVAEHGDEFVLLQKALMSLPNGDRIALEWQRSHDAAIELLRGQPFDICFVEDRVAGRDGAAFVRDAVNRGLNTPIVLVTGAADDDVYRRAMRLGAADYVAKARLAEPLDLERTIFHALERGRTSVALMASDRMVTMGTLAAGIAHEINNPLAALIGNLDVLSAELADIDPQEGIAPSALAELREIAEDSRNAADRVRVIVRDLKIFSRVDEERLEAVDLRRVFEGVIKMAWNEIRHRARLVKDYGEVPCVEANEARLGQAFLNLLINAAHAIPEGNAERNEIRIVARTADDGRAVVEVRDSGSGIPSELLSRIFEPFFTTKPIGVGTGLGLPITATIVSRLRGTIEVESVVGRGTTMRVTLPAARLRLPNAEPAGMPETEPSRRARILLVEDDETVARAIVRAIGADHDVAVQLSARDALSEIAAGTRYDVILCDVMMPVVSGEDFYNELASIAPQLVNRIIFITGAAFTPTQRAFLDRVSNLRIEKPFDVQNLRALLRNAVRMNDIGGEE